MEFTKQGAGGAPAPTLIHLERCSAAVAIDASASAHKYVASQSEPQTCPHNRMTADCTQMKRLNTFGGLRSGGLQNNEVQQWRGLNRCTEEASIRAGIQKTSLQPQTVRLGHHLPRYLTSPFRSCNWSAAETGTDKTLIVPLGNGMCFNTGRCCTGMQSRSNQVPGDAFTKSIQNKERLVRLV